MPSGSERPKHGDLEPTKKRAYEAPRLVEYGSVAKLTLGNNGTHVDHISTMAMK